MKAGPKPGAKEPECVLDLASPLMRLAEYSPGKNAECPSAHPVPVNCKSC